VHSYIYSDVNNLVMIALATKTCKIIKIGQDLTDLQLNVHGQFSRTTVYSYGSHCAACDKRSVCVTVARTVCVIRV